MKNVNADKFGKMANSVPESNPHDEDIMIPSIETIKDIVSEMPERGAVD